MRRSGDRALAAIAVALFGALPAGAQQNSASREGSIGAAIVQAVSVQKSQDLVLGEFRPGEAPGTVELHVIPSSSAASRTSSGGVALAGSAFSAAEFSLSAHAGAPVQFAVLLPPSITIQRVGGAESMRVDGFRGSIREVCPPGPCASSPYMLQVGATLHVEAGQRAGRYVGTFTVTVNQL
ncbi:MAG: DUF4402 domain-containing protein [Acidobacteriota bacterium]